MKIKELNTDELNNVNGGGWIADLAAAAREVYNTLTGCGCSSSPPPSTPTGCLGVGETGFPQP